MAKYLADTTILVDHLREVEAAKEFLINEAPHISLTSIAELIEGAKNKSHLRQINKTVSRLDIIPINEKISSLAVGLMQEYFLSNHLEFLDALIAATAIEENLTLVTANVRHFSPIKGLKLMSWRNVTVN